MSCKSMIVAASGEAEDATVLAASVRLAGLWSAQVRVLPAFLQPDAELIYCGIEKALAFKRESQKQLEQLVRSIAGQDGLSAEDIGVGPSR